MARKTLNHKVETEGRDLGKTFLITEMPSDQAEKWAFRALQALAASGVELPEDFRSIPMARLAGLGLKALAQVQWHIAEPLLDEMMECVKVLPPNGQPRDILTENDIEEPMTRFALRKEVFLLHVGFFTAGLAQIMD